MAERLVSALRGLYNTRGLDLNAGQQALLKEFFNLFSTTQGPQTDSDVMVIKQKIEFDLKKYRKEVFETIEDFLEVDNGAPFTSKDAVTYCEETYKRSNVCDSDNFCKFTSGYVYGGYCNLDTKKVDLYFNIAYIILCTQTTPETKDDQDTDLLLTRIIEYYGDPVPDNRESWYDIDKNIKCNHLKTNHDFKTNIHELDQNLMRESLSSAGELTSEEKENITKAYKDYQDNPSSTAYQTLSQKLKNIIPNKKNLRTGILLAAGALSIAGLFYLYYSMQQTTEQTTEQVGESTTWTQSNYTTLINVADKMWRSYYELGKKWIGFAQSDIYQPLGLPSGAEIYSQYSAVPQYPSVPSQPPILSLSSTDPSTASVLYNRAPTGVMRVASTVADLGWLTSVLPSLWQGLGATALGVATGAGLSWLRNRFRGWFDKKREEITEFFLILRQSRNETISAFAERVKEKSKKYKSLRIKAITKDISQEKDINPHIQSLLETVDILKVKGYPEKQLKQLNLSSNNLRAKVLKISTDNEEIDLSTYKHIVDQIASSPIINLLMPTINRETATRALFLETFKALIANPKLRNLDLENFQFFVKTIVATIPFIDKNDQDRLYEKFGGEDCERWSIQLAFPIMAKQHKERKFTNSETEKATECSEPLDMQEFMKKYDNLEWFWDYTYNIAKETEEPTRWYTQRFKPRAEAFKNTFPNDWETIPWVIEDVDLKEYNIEDILKDVGKLTLKNVRNVDSFQFPQEMTVTDLVIEPAMLTSN